jgi:hypothetical protein
MEFYSTTKKNKILSFAGKWMKLENIILSEVSEVRPKAASSLSYTDYRHYRPKTNAAILWDLGYTKGKPCSECD